MAARKRRSRKKIKGRMSLLAAALFILFIIFFQAARFLGSPSGSVFLLDMGFDSKYPEVRDEVNQRVIRALMENGVKRSGMEIIPRTEGEGYFIKAPLPANRSLTRVNIALDQAVEEMGARITECREKESGQVLDMIIGTGRRVTHHCLIRRSSRVSEANSRIAIVVDDFGYSYNGAASDFLELDAGITLSVIPGLKHSREICEKAAGAGKSYICHLPMEPEEGKCQGGYCVTVAMNDREIERTVYGALEVIPGAAGMNNHMGSKATSDRRVMSAVMRACRQRNLFFLDSLTSPHSVAAETAESMGMPRLVNDLFLDNRGDDIRGNMLKLIRLSERRGWAIGIMHVHSESFRELKWLVEEAEKRGIELITLKDLITLIAGKEA